MLEGNLNLVHDSRNEMQTVHRNTDFILEWICEDDRNGEKAKPPVTTAVENDISAGHETFHNSHTVWNRLNIVRGREWLKYELLVLYIG